LDKTELVEKLKNKSQTFGNILWDTLTPFERERVLKRIEKQLPEIESKYELSKPTPEPDDRQVKFEDEQPIKAPEPKQEPASKPAKPAQTPPEASDPMPFERSVWSTKTLYQIAHQDMIEQRTTIMKFLLDTYGIEAVEEFFLNQNPQWAEQLKVGKMKKIFAKLISKLAPRMIMNKLSDIIIENAQYLVPLENININEAFDDFKIIEITKCPVLKQFKKTLKSLKFSNLEERYICTFACVPVLDQMAQVGNCNVTSEYFEKGCHLKVALNAKGFDALKSPEGEKAAPIRNGPSK
jgi:hypothetical protein